MSGEPENLVLLLLRRMDAKIDRLTDDSQDLKHRMTSLESQVANLAATEANHYASLAVRLDRLTDRVDRLERRLDIGEPVA
jgi:uncharacterized protein YdcH (DUF465 family)